MKTHSNNRILAHTTYYKIFIVSVTIVASISSVQAAPITLSFEDVPGSENSNLLYIPSSYAGFNWDNFRVIHESRHPNSGYSRGVVDGEWAAINKGGQVASIISEDPFNFIGAWFTAEHTAQNTLTIRGFQDGDELYTTTVNINYTTPTWVMLDWEGIDNLEIIAGQGRNFVMDGFEYSNYDNLRVSKDLNAVPEPATLSLLGFGIVGITLRHFRKKA